MEKLYTVTKTRPGADCGSDHELLITKFRLKLKKVGKITRPFRYDLNQIPYDYTVEMTNRFKGLDLIDRAPERGKAGGGARVTAGPKRPHLSVCPGPNFPLQGRQGSRGCIPGSPGQIVLQIC